MCPDSVGAVVLDSELVGWGLQMLSPYHQFDIPWPEPRALQMRFMITTYRTLIQISWIHGFDWFGPCRYRGKIIIPVHSTLFKYLWVSDEVIACDQSLAILAVMLISWACGNSTLAIDVGMSPWMPSWSRCSSATVHIWMHILYVLYKNT